MSSVIAIQCSTDAADALGGDDHLIERQGSLRRIGDVILWPERVEDKRGRAAETQVELLIGGRRGGGAIGGGCPPRGGTRAGPAAHPARIRAADPRGGGL